MNTIKLHISEINVLERRILGDIFRNFQVLHLLKDLLQQPCLNYLN